LDERGKDRHCRGFLGDERVLFGRSSGKRRPRKRKRKRKGKGKGKGKEKGEGSERDLEKFGGTRTLSGINNGALFVKVAELWGHHLGVLEGRKTL